MKAAISPYSMAVAADALLAVAAPASVIKVAASAMRMLFNIVISCPIRSRTGEIRMGRPSEDFYSRSKIGEEASVTPSPAPIPVQRRRVLRALRTLLPLG